MKIVVCVKQIPDPASPYELDPDSYYVVRPADQVLDDTDRYGVEVALQLSDEIGDAASVTLLSMSPGGSQQGIRQALAMGADGAILVEDETLRGADALTTSQVLAAAAKRAEADLVITGTESTDGYTGVVPQQVAELMGAPSLTFARKVEHVDGKIRIERQTQAGYDVVEGALPAVLSVTSGVVEPRYPTFKGIMQAKSKPVETLTAADLGVAPDVQQKITSVEDVASRQAGDIVEDEGEGHLRIIEKLEEVKVV
ncbi:MAG: electron transfer flavoprotein subunit beta/FixA family protein [bacterium]|nr:electron transfer flavoprotein subunit beta/FixA family protein [bacterium]